MKKWVERNIIFPRVNESKLRMRRELQEQEIIRHIITDLENRDMQSLYRNQAGQSRLKRYSIVSDKKFDLALLRFSKSPRSHSLNSDDSLQDSDSAVPKRQVGAALELQERKKEVYRSKLAKEHLRRLKSLQVEAESAISQTADVASILLANELPRKRRSLGRNRSSKIRTEAAVQETSPRLPPMQDYLNQFLNVRQAKQFGYGVGSRLEGRKESKVKLPPLERVGSRAKKTFKITSVKGWEVGKDTCYLDL